MDAENLRGRAGNRRSQGHQRGVRVLCPALHAHVACLRCMRRWPDSLTCCLVGMSERRAGQRTNGQTRCRSHREEPLPHGLAPFRQRHCHSPLTASGAFRHIQARFEGPCVLSVFDTAGGNRTASDAPAHSVAAEALVGEADRRPASHVYAEECVGPDQLVRGKRGVDAVEVREDADARSWPPGSLAPACERPRLKANPSALDPDRLAGKTPLKLGETPERVTVRWLLACLARRRLGLGRLGRRRPGRRRRGRRGLCRARGRRRLPRRRSFPIPSATRRIRAQRQEHSESAQNSPAPEGSAHRRSNSSPLSHAGSARKHPGP